MTFEVYHHGGTVSRGIHLRRFTAAAKMASLAMDWNVTPNTLGQFATGTGPYRKDPPRVRSDRRLPLRYTREGQRLAEETYAASHPWNPRYLGERTERFLEAGIA